MKRIIEIITLVIIVGACSGCGTAEVYNEPVSAVERADYIISKDLNDAEQRNRARTLYQTGLDGLHRIGNAQDRNFVEVHGHAGIAIVMMYDLIRISTLISDQITRNQGTDFDFERLIPLFMASCQGVVIPMTNHFDAAIEASTGEYRLNIEDAEIQFYRLHQPLMSINLSGEWDLAELHIMRALFLLIEVGLENVLLYDGAFKFLIEFLNDVTAGNINFEHEFVSFLNQPGKTFENPLLDDLFGPISEGGREMLTENRYRFGLVFVSLGTAMEHMINETDDQTDDYFNREQWIEDLLMIFGLDPTMLEDIVSLMPVGDDFQVVLLKVVADLMLSLGHSAWGEELFNPADVIDSALASLGLAGFGDMIAINLPLMDLSAFTTNPIDDLRELLPAFYAEDIHNEQGEIIHRAGDFVLGGSEQFDDDGETFTDDGQAFNDVAHLHPNGFREDPPNGSYDEMYVYFSNPSINGLFLTQENGKLLPLDGGDVNRSLTEIMNLIAKFF
jgi:hypothetical protein